MLAGAGSLLLQTGQPGRIRFYWVLLFLDFEVVGKQIKRSQF
jgi:hypothetical protein